MAMPGKVNNASCAQKAQRNGKERDFAKLTGFPGLGTGGGCIWHEVAYTGQKIVTAIRHLTYSREDNE
jgi:hypothetical protein